MAISIEAAQQELRAVIERGVPLNIAPQGFLNDIPLRRSAVLVLFGALDQAAAEPGASVPVPAALDVLLTRRADGMRHHAGQIAFPGGGAEPEDDGPAATALREAAEETGLDPTGVEVLGLLPEVHIPVSNNLVTPVVGWWKLPSEVAADHAESVEVFRTPVAELLNPECRGVSVLRRGEAEFRGPAFELGAQFGGHLVWGFTGILLATLFEELGWAPDWDRSREIQLRG